MKSKLILGTVQFGLNYGINNILDKPAENQVKEILDYAHSQGVGTLDTADAYGNASEVIGNYTANTTNEFDINTKFKEGDFSLENQLDDSLTKLSKDAVNVYFYHSFHDFINQPKLKVQLLDLKEKGCIKKIGLSVYENEEFLKACDSDFIDVIQFPFNLLDNYSKRGELIKVAKNKGKELQVRSVFLQGLFFKSIIDLPNKLKPLKKYLEKLNEIAESEAVSMEQLALGYVLQHQEIDHVIIGVDSLIQLKNNINISKKGISKEATDSINEVNVKKVELLYPKNW